MLLNSIFAIAARHLSHTTDFDPLISNMYLDECLKYLTPMLSDASSLSDENLFAATVILRMLEEMDGKKEGHAPRKKRRRANVRVQVLTRAMIITAICWEFRHS